MIIIVDQTRFLIWSKILLIEIITMTLLCIGIFLIIIDKISTSKKCAWNELNWNNWQLKGERKDVARWNQWSIFLTQKINGNISYLREKEFQRLKEQWRHLCINHSDKTMMKTLTMRITTIKFIYFTLKKEINIIFFNWILFKKILDPTTNSLRRFRWSNLWSGVRWFVKGYIF